MLSGLITDVTDRFEKALGHTLKRITLHVFKRTGVREVRAAERALTGRGVDFALVHVNRDSPLWLMEEKPNGKMTSPAPGTVVALRPHDRLLVTGEPGDEGQRAIRVQVDLRGVHNRREFDGLHQVTRVRTNIRGADQPVAAQRTQAGPHAGQAEL